MSAHHLICSYPNEGRQLRRFITALLKKGVCTKIQRLNYVKSYTLVEGLIHRQEEKLLLIVTTEDKKEDCKALIKKLHPNKEEAIHELHTTI